MVAVDGRRWLLACRDEIQCETREPAAVSGRDIRDKMPQGRDGRAVRRLMNELQMILHEHPVGARRAARGLLHANAVWLWGFGTICAVEPRELAPLASDDDWLDDLWRMHEGVRHATPAEMLRGARNRVRPMLVAYVDSANAAATPAVRLDTASIPLRAASPRNRVRLHSRRGPLRRARVASGVLRWAFWRRLAQRAVVVIVRIDAASMQARLPEIVGARLHPVLRESTARAALRRASSTSASSGCCRSARWAALPPRWTC